MECCQDGYGLGFRTFVLQGGEDGWFTQEALEELVDTIKTTYPDCAVTLSLGERSRESYEGLFRAGADRYLLRHETADEAHYESLHPKELSAERRKQCLWDLKEIGYQTGTGFMVIPILATFHDLFPRQAVALRFLVAPADATVITVILTIIGELNQSPGINLVPKILMLQSSCFFEQILCRILIAVLD